MPTAKTQLTARSMKLLREQGYDVEKVEYWLSFGGKGGVRKDLWGFVDVLAMNDDEVVGVQVTSRSNMSARVKKARKSQHFRRFCLHNKFVVHGWDKYKNRWRLKEKEVT